jgi:hypothetical protein
VWLVGGDGEGSKDPRYLHFIPNAAIIIMVYHFNLSLAKLPPPPPFCGTFCKLYRSKEDFIAMSGKSLPSALYICLEQVNTDHANNEKPRNRFQIFLQIFIYFLRIVSF